MLFQLRDVIQISWKVCKALEHAHSRNVIHHDIKPQNIIIDKGNDVKVTDFGLASVTTQSIASLTRNELIGTLMYGAPEQIRGIRGDQKSDIYSLGVVMFEMLTGEKPFDSEDVRGLVYKPIHESPKKVSEFRPDVPPRLNWVVVTAMSKSPMDRFHSVSSMRETIEQVALEMNISLVNYNISFYQRVKETFFYWGWDRLGDIVTELGANAVSWGIGLYICTNYIFCWIRNYSRTIRRTV